MAKYFLSTYSLRLKNKNDGKYVNLAAFDNKKDFYNLFNDFLKLIAKETQVFENKAKGIKKCLTLNDKDGMHPKSIERIVYGFFASGTSGEEISISKLENKKLKVISIIGKDNYLGKPVFYYLKVPSHGNTAFFILQRQSSYGIKDLFQRFFKEFMKRESLYNNYSFELGESLNSKLFNYIIDTGRLIEMSVVKRGVPNRWDDLADPEKQQDVTYGKMKTIITSDRNKSLPFKDLAKNFFKSKTKNSEEKVVEIFGEFDEIDFEFEINGSKKTFHMLKGNSAPDFDISAKVDPDNLLKSFKNEAESLIKDMEKDYDGLS